MLILIRLLAMSFFVAWAVFCGGIVLSMAGAVSYEAAFPFVIYALIYLVTVLSSGGMVMIWKLIEVAR